MFIRKGGLADSRAILKVYRGAFGPLVPRLDPPPAVRAYDEGAMVRSLQKHESAVCDTGDGLVGCVFYRPMRRGCYLFRLSVMPEWQGLGIATRLIQHVEEEAAASGRPLVALTVRLALEDNVRLYRGLGYREVSRYPYKGQPHPSFARMVKRVA